AVAFEDSYVGVGAAKNAGMKCVAVASSFPIEELRPLADLAVPSFEAVSLEKLQELFSPVSN
ncbi:MAG: HAD family phosphatase, partial [Acidobacteria bacterium]|nr:HAD family phosphatase [Acidobacteriota bacterium]